MYFEYWSEVLFDGHVLIHSSSLKISCRFSIQEKQLALKLGRQKKIQMIDGQQVEVLPGMGSDDEEEEEGDIMAVDGADGQQYVVLEVIQLADGEEQAVVIGDGNSELLSESILPDHGMYLFIVCLLKLLTVTCLLSQIWMKMF